MDVTGFVDNTHPALAKFLEDPVVRDDSPDHCRECYVCKAGESMKREELAPPTMIVGIKSPYHSLGSERYRLLTSVRRVEPRMKKASSNEQRVGSAWDPLQAEFSHRPLTY